MTVEIVIPNDIEISHERRILELLFKKGNFEHIEKFPDINLVEKLQKNPAQDSFNYALALKGNDLIREVVKLHTQYKQVSDPQPGDYVLYFNSKDPLPGVAKHIGICLQGNRVLSKWGLVNVYDHPLFLVPESFGEKIIFVRKP